MALLLSPHSDVYDDGGLHERAPPNRFSDDPAWLFSPELLSIPDIKHRLKQPRRQLSSYALYISSHIALEGPYTEPSPSPSPTSVRASSPADPPPIFHHGNHQLPTPDSIEALSRSSTWSKGIDSPTDTFAVPRPHKAGQAKQFRRSKDSIKSKDGNEKRNLRKRGRQESGITKAIGTRCNTHAMTTRSKGRVSRDAMR